MQKQEQLRSAAKLGQRERYHVAFFTKANQIALAFVITILACWLLPSIPQFKQNLEQLEYLTLVDAEYSLDILKAIKNTNLSREQLRQDPELALQDIAQALQNEQEKTDILWLYYIILRPIALSKTYPLAARTQGKSLLKEYVSAFSSDFALQENQLKILAQDALAVGSPSMAIVFYQRVLSMNKGQSVAFYGDAVRTALWANLCVPTSKLAFEAQQRARKKADKRYFFFMGIQSLFQCSQFDAAMQSVDSHIGDLQNDALTYQLLAEYAIKANRPDLASRYITKSLELRGDVRFD